jgi:hypothetical protein
MFLMGKAQAIKAKQERRDIRGGIFGGGKTIRSIGCG